MEIKTKYEELSSRQTNLVEENNKVRNQNKDLKDKIRIDQTRTQVDSEKNELDKKLNNYCGRSVYLGQRHLKEASLWPKGLTLSTN